MRYRIYVKSYLTCLAVIVLIEFLNFAVFSHMLEHNLATQVGDYTDARIVALGEEVQQRLCACPPLSELQRAELEEYLTAVATILPRVRIWISSGDDEVLARNFDGPIPDLADAALHTGSPPPLVQYPLTLDDGSPALLNLVFLDSEERIIASHWTILKLILSYNFYGIIIALGLLILPFRHYIGTPLIALSKTVSEMTHGNLKARCDIKGDDELWDLSRSFNDMADTIENMVESTRELTANISHEIRSPLARISITEGILRDQLGDAEECLPCLDAIQTEIEDMDHLVGRILDLSKQDINKLSARKEPLNLTAGARQLMERYAPSLERNDIVFSAVIPSEEISIMAEPKDFCSALNNLFDNALKFTPRGGRIHFTLNRHDQRVSISLTNTCDLAPDADLEKIFEPFYRLPESHSSGTGLGLPITRKIIINHGGTIRADRQSDGLRLRIDGLDMICHLSDNR